MKRKNQAEWVAAFRAAWMRAFEAAVLAEMPELAGRLNWDAATFFYNSGMTAVDAAARFVKRMQEK